MNIILVIPQSESVCYCLAMAEGNLARAGLTGKLCKMFYSTPSRTDSKSMSTQPRPRYATTRVTLYFSLHHSLSPSAPPLPSPSGWPQIYSRGGVQPTRSTRRRPASCSECAKSPLSCNLTPPPRRRRQWLR